MEGTAAPSSLARRLRALDSRPYGAYRSLAGSHDLGIGKLIIDKVQVDPYAPPSLMRVVVAGPEIPAELTADRTGRIAAEDYLTRRLIAEIAKLPGGGRGIDAGRATQHILERTTIRIDQDVEIRLLVSLPASGRRIRGHQAARLLTEDLPRVIRAAILEADLTAMAAHVAHVRDVEWLRGQLADLDLVAFVSSGSILPRRSGVSDRPLPGAVPFSPPHSLSVSLTLPSGREITGMGIPEGVTVIVGGGFHGKSTLLRALERGIHPQVVGDGREFVVTRSDALSIRAEDGRAVTSADISPFITNLPGGADTTDFSTTNASGSTSQAANLMEGLAAGARVLLIDEDTSATNFMIRDDRMRRLIPERYEPITPLADRARELAEAGISIVLVTGGSSQFLDVADRVIAMRNYVPSDVTEEARGLSTPRPRPRPADLAGAAQRISQRVLDPTCLRARKPPRASGKTIRLGSETIDLTALSGLLEEPQTRAIARCLDLLATERASIGELLDDLEHLIDTSGLSALSDRPHPGLLARPRRFEIHAALNRLRSLSLIDHHS
ncbi:MAG: ABC-ATPase domain-containing protein [Flaviflexus sp.]|nr:ABC-ATPase domain-containing protein [Flaviflexus sp.]